MVWGLPKKICSEVVEARRMNNRVMEYVLFFEKHMQRLTCGYALSSRRSLEENESLYELKMDFYKL